MLINNQPHKTISFIDEDVSIEIIDQTKLPHEFIKVKLATLNEAANAIKKMLVRGAPLIGVTGAYGVVLGLKDDCSNEGVKKIVKSLIETRPTAVNLKWALNRMSEKVMSFEPSKRLEEAIKEAKDIEKEDMNELLNQKILVLCEDNNLDTIKNVLYQIRCNIFHGEKIPGDVNDDTIVKSANPVLKYILNYLINEQEIRNF